MKVLDRKVAISIPQQHNSGRRYRLEDEENSSNIALDPQHRSLIMKHMARNDAELSNTLDRVNNPGQVSMSVGASFTHHLTY